MSKKLILAGAIALATALPAKADMLGIYVGAQAWMSETTGGFAEQSTLIDFSYDKKTTTNLYLKFEHPLPLIPNARIRTGKLSGAGFTTLSSSFAFGGKTYAGDTRIETSTDFTNNDATLYWEILDNDLIAFDIGITAKNISGDFMVEGSNGKMSSEDINVWIPMAYAAAKVRIPFAGLYVYADSNLLSVGDNDVHDYEVGLGFDIIDNLVVDVAVTAGYREVGVVLDDVSGVYSDLKFGGFFAGLEVHF